MNRTVWQASGHESNFTDPLVDCKTCKARFRQDQIAESQCPRKPSQASGRIRRVPADRAAQVQPDVQDLRRPGGGKRRRRSTCAPRRPRAFSSTSRTSAIQRASRSPSASPRSARAFATRSRPSSSSSARANSSRWRSSFSASRKPARSGTASGATSGSPGIRTLGLKGDNLRLREHDKDELAFYSIGTSDVEYKFPWGWGELEGIAHRGDYDLKQHIKFSGKDLSYFDDETKERFVPHVIEPSAGATRATLAFLCEAYRRGKGRRGNADGAATPPPAGAGEGGDFPAGEERGHARAGDGASTRSCKKHFAVFYDEKGAVGRRYRRQDEAGTPFCMTIDGQTAEDQTVTVRERDSMKQERIGVDRIKGCLMDLLSD